MSRGARARPEINIKGSELTHAGGERDSARGLGGEESRNTTALRWRKQQRRRRPHKPDCSKARAGGLRARAQAQARARAQAQAQAQARARAREAAATRPGPV